MRRPPPGFILLPYTTLFRSNQPRPGAFGIARFRIWATTSATPLNFGLPVAVERRRAGRGPRSEEHTSELQSLRHIVCRLLLEKKKANCITRSYTLRKSY